MTSRATPVPLAFRFGIFALQESDRPDVAAHYLSLDDEARIRRFGIKLSDEGVAHLIERLPFSPMTWGLFVGGRLKGTCMVLYDKDSRHKGEFAITLSEGMRKSGWGGLMTKMALDAAYHHGMDEVEINYIAQNTPMARLASRFPGTLVKEFGECCKTVELKNWVEAQLLEDECIYA